MKVKMTQRRHSVGNESKNDTEKEQAEMTEKEEKMREREQII
jgi:hypothetical protein